MEPVKLLERAATGAAHAIRHPIASAAYAAGIARGVAGASVRILSGHGPFPQQRTDDLHEARKARESARPGVPEPQRVPKPVPPPHAEDVVPAPEPEPGESVATEAKAVSRESEHGDAGPASDEEIDAWIDEAMAGRQDVDVETPVGTTGADVGHNPDTAEADLQQPGTEPLLDPSTATAIGRESEMMRKDAERDPE